MAVGKAHLIKNLRNPRGEKARPNYDAIKKLADVLGLELYFGPPREPIPHPPQGDEELTFVPRFDISAAAGTGLRNGENEQPVSHLAFRASWLRNQGLVASEAVLIDVRGDSMEPELHDGDVILVDTRQIPPRPGKTYVFRDIDDSIRVKRLASQHETAYFISLNKNYPTETRSGTDAEGIHIIGRVAWFARTLE